MYCASSYSMRTPAPTIGRIPVAKPFIASDEIAF
jgi:hypothetical protein